MNYLYQAMDRYAQHYPTNLHNRKLVKNYLMKIAMYDDNNWDYTLRIIEEIVEEFCTCV